MSTRDCHTWVLAHISPIHTHTPTHPHTHTQVLFDHDGCLKKYSGVMEVLQEFYEVRLDVYRKRKEWLEGQLEAESSRLNNQARFIMEKIEGKVVVGE